MNSLNSIQSVNNKSLSNRTNIPSSSNSQYANLTPLVIANSGFTDPTLASGTNVELIGNVTSSLTDTSSLPGWTITYTKTGGATIAVGLADTLFVTDLSPTYPQSCYFNFQQTSGQCVLSQTTYIQTPGTYTESVWATPFIQQSSIVYNATNMFSVSLNGISSSPVSLSTTSQIWQQISVTTSITAEGIYPISINLSNTDTSQLTVIFFTDCSIVSG